MRLRNPRPPRAEAGAALRPAYLRSSKLSAWLLPALLAVVAVVRAAVERRTPFSVRRTGLLDEPAHVATAALALLVLAQLVRLPTRFYVAALIASAAIDLDHIPVYLGVPHIAVARGGRPFTHSLATVGVVLVT